MIVLVNGTIWLNLGVKELYVNIIIHKLFLYVLQMLYLSTIIAHMYNVYNSLMHTYEHKITYLFKVCNIIDILLLLYY